ncbi:lipopolysaccharide kinase InaA family protein [Spongorhabdus nitratireducens]
MQKLNQDRYQALREGCRVIEKDGYGDKVLGLRDGTILKIFRVKRTLSSARFFPYSRRFAKNAGLLQQRGIPTIDVIGLYELPAKGLTAVHYHPLPGDTVRQALRQLDAGSEERAQLLEKLAALTAQLHENGVLFRSYHMGNVIVMPDGELGLIDISDMRCQSKPLSERQRLRNLRHMSRYSEDVSALCAPAFTTHYARLGQVPLSAVEHIFQTAASPC